MTEDKETNARLSSLERSVEKLAGRIDTEFRSFDRRHAEMGENLKTVGKDVTYLLARVRDGNGRLSLEDTQQEHAGRLKEAEEKISKLQEADKVDRQGRWQIVATLVAGFFSLVAVAISVFWKG